MSFALDPNILLYASDSGSPHHNKGKFFLEECMQKEELLCLGWPTTIGLFSASIINESGRPFPSNRVNALT